jgi:hypothetical protein
MVFQSLFVVAACVAVVVRCAPTKLQDRQADVPDYVLKYGRYFPIVKVVGVRPVNLELDPVSDLSNSSKCNEHYFKCTNRLTHSSTGRIPPL